MSLILEALRKSEAERRRGVPPDLHAELPPPTPPLRRGVPAWGWTVLAVAVAVLAAWFWSSQPSGPDNVETPRSAAAAAGVDGSNPASIDDSSAASPETRLPARTPAQRVPPMQETAVTAAPATETPLAGTPSVAAPQTAAVAPPIGVAQPPRRDTPAPAASAAVPTTAEPREATQASVPAAPAGDGRVLDIAELDPGTRQALPSLKLSMHLWNEDPARRFVILDGRRLAEGDRIGEASIVRIERDGVVLQWQGRGIRIPVH
jgi:general secretion pathway protein B